MHNHDNKASIYFNMKMLRAFSTSQRRNPGERPRQIHLFISTTEKSVQTKRETENRVNKHLA